MQFDYPDDICFDCSRCGLCCGDTPEKTRHILMLRADTEKISILTGLPVNKFAHEIVGKMPYIYEMNKKPENGECVFLEDNQCTLYAHRPLICRFYPFELSTNDEGKYVFRVTLECPGVRHLGTFGVGSKLNSDYFKVLLDLACTELNEASD